MLEKDKQRIISQQEKYAMKKKNAEECELNTKTINHFFNVCK